MDYFICLHYMWCKYYCQTIC